MEHKTLSSRRQNLFLQNLLALGFDIPAMTKEHKIVFDTKMFSLPNKKAFEVVSYFLFSKLNQLCSRKYSIIWPLVDNTDQKQFQKTTFSYLTQIAQESEIKFPLVLNSVFSSFGGEAFLNLYFAFSTHVVYQVNKSFAPVLKRPKLNPKSPRHAIEMLKLTSISSVEKFQALTNVTKSHLETYFQIAQKLTDCVERLKLSNSKSQSMLEEKVKAAIKLFTQNDNSFEKSLEGLVLQNKKYQEKVESLWSKLEKFLSTEQNLWGCISSELDDNTKPILEGSACSSFTVSNNLKNNYEKRYEAELPEEKNSLSIPRFLKLFSLVLESYIDSIKRGKFSETYKLQILEDTSELDKSLKMSQSLCSRLEEGNIGNKKHVDALMEKINLVDFTEDRADFIEDLPPSPKYSKSILDFDNAKESPFLYPCIQDVKLDEKMKEISEEDISPSLNEVANIDYSVFSPIQVREINSVTSSSHVLKYSCLEESDDERNFFQRFAKSSLAKDSVSDLPDIDIPLSLLHEESLNSQTLCDQSSFSFLD